MPDKTSKYLLSDADALRRIKFAQFRAQVPALVAVAVAIALKTIFPNAGNWLFTFSLILAIAAIAVYFFIGLCFRFRQRIPLPPENVLLSPIEGKIDIRRNGDITLLNIRKNLLDSVELRSPHSGCRLEDGVLYLDTDAGRISIRFSFARIQWFVEPDFTAGSIIGIVAGNGSCSVIFPGKPELIVQTGDPINAAEPLYNMIPTLEKPTQIHPTENPEPTPEGDIV